jgi:hypothetical protein
MSVIARAFFAAVGFACAAPAFAADLPTKKPEPAPIPEPVLPSTWHVDMTAYLWATSLAGNTGVGPFPTNPFFLSFGDILKHLEGAFMGAIIARNDTFIGGLDLIWTRVGTNETFEEPSSPVFGVGANLKLTASIVTAFGGVRIPVGPPNLSLYGIVGARNFTDKISITLQAPVPGFTHSASKTEDWVDPVAGIYAHYRIDDKWFVNAEGDGGGVYNSATAQGLGAVGYNWTQNIASTLGYRVLYTYDKANNAANGSYRLLQWMYGPFAAIKYTF